MAVDAEDLLQEVTDRCFSRGVPAQKWTSQIIEAGRNVSSTSSTASSAAFSQKLSGILVDYLYAVPTSRLVVTYIDAALSASLVQAGHVFSALVLDSDPLDLREDAYVAVCEALNRHASSTASTLLDERQSADTLWTIVAISADSVRNALEKHLAPVSRFFINVLSNLTISYQSIADKASLSGSEPANQALKACIEAADKATAQEELLILRSIQTALNLSAPSHASEKTERKHARSADEPPKSSSHREKMAVGESAAMADALRLASALSNTWTTSCTLEAVISGKLGGISGIFVPIDPEISNFLHLCVDQLTEMHIKVEAAEMLLSRRFNNKEPGMSNHECQSTFYFEMLYGAAVACASIASTPPTLGGSEAYASVWRSALCGLVPHIIADLEAGLDESASTSARVSRALHGLLVGASQIIEGCEVAIAQSEEIKRRNGGDEDMEMMLDAFIGSDTPPRQAVRAALVRSLVELKLIEDGAWKSIPGAESLNDDWQLLSLSFQGEVYGTDQSLDMLIEQRFTGGDDVQELFDRFVSDYAAQEAFAAVLLRLLEDWNDLEPLSRICRALVASPSALEGLLLYVSPMQLLHPFVAVLDREDLNESGDEPSVLASIILFTQLLVQRGLLAGFQVEDLIGQEDHFLSTYIRSSSAVLDLSSLEEAEQNLFSRWVKALYDSDGISDELIRDSSPQFLLRMAPTLLSQSIEACTAGVIDMDTLRGGLSYFLQDLLNFTLPGALRWLVSDIEMLTWSNSSENSASSKAFTVRCEVLTTFTLAESCPSTVLKLVASDSQALLTELSLKAAQGDTAVTTSPSLESDGNVGSQQQQQQQQQQQEQHQQQQWISPELSVLKVKMDSEFKTLPLQRTSLWIRAGAHQHDLPNDQFPSQHREAQAPASTSPTDPLLQQSAPVTPFSDSMFGLYHGLEHASRIRGTVNVVNRLAKAIEAKLQHSDTASSPTRAAAATKNVERALASLLTFDALLSLNKEVEDGDEDSEGAPAPFVLHFVDLVPLFEQDVALQVALSIVRALRLTLDLLSAFPSLEKEREAHNDMQDVQGGEEDAEKSQGNETAGGRQSRKAMAVEIGRAAESLLALKIRKGAGQADRARALLASFSHASEKKGKKEEGQEKGAMELVFETALEQGRSALVS